ncbi:glycosyltransferase family 39 protein [Lacisediminihabitans sp.]|uniref:glycosyltransferase family 39 protein n=1 Tax=Lacisediminihabitans sp. TaxID=2787631 RepID=UPI00374DACF4
MDHGSTGTVRLPRGFGWLVAALGTAAALVSAAGSWIPSLWGDEAASLLSAQRPLPSLFVMLGHVDAVHGAYYLLLHGWIRLAGTTPFALRLPSAVAVGLAVAAVTLIAARLRSPRVAVAAGIICCLLPRVTYMGEEARSYAASAAIAAWLTYLLVELMRRQSPPVWLWVAYGTLLAAGVYLFLYVGLLVLAHAIVLAASRAGRAVLTRWTIACAAALLAVSPLVFWAIDERRQIAYLASRTEVSFGTLTVSLWFGSVEFAVIAWLLILVALATPLVARIRRRDLTGLRAPRPPSLELVAATWLFVPSLTLVTSQFFVADFTARYLSYCAPAAALLIACGVDRLASRRGWAIAASTVAVVALATPAYLAQRGPYSKNDSDWSAISATLGVRARAGDAVAFDESVRPSRRPRLALRTYPAGFAGLHDVMLEAPYYRNTSWPDRVYSLAKTASLGRLAAVDRLWLVEYATPTHVDAYGIDTLAALGFARTAEYRTHRSVIFLFSRQPTSGT